jgi:ankyrin repeat protein
MSKNHGAMPDAMPDAMKFITAAKTGDLEHIKTAIDRNIDVNCRYFEQGESALEAAVFANQIAAIRLLLQKGADVNVKFNVNLVKATTLLHVVKSSEATILLLQAGANPRMKNSRGLTPVDYQVVFNTDICRILISAGADPKHYVIENPLPLNPQLMVWIRPKIILRPGQRAVLIWGRKNRDAKETLGKLCKDLLKMIIVWTDRALWEDFKRNVTMELIESLVS